MESSTFNFLSFPGKVHLVTSDEEVNFLAKQLLKVREFGFDTETRPAFKKGEVYQVALLQLATETDAFLFRLHQIRNFDVFKTIFENPDVMKAGVAIRDDLKQLQKRFQFKPEGFVELQDLAKKKGLKILVSKE